MLYLGIDVGKKWHEAALLDEADEVVWRQRFRSNRSGIRSLAERLAGVVPAELTVGLEATGVYWITLHQWLVGRGAAKVLVLNPLQTRAFRNANLRGSKTDRIDAVSIARLIRWTRRAGAVREAASVRTAASSAALTGRIQSLFANDHFSCNDNCDNTMQDQSNSNHSARGPITGHY